MEGLLRGAFDVILELPQMLRGLLSRSSVRDDPTLEDGLLADGSFGQYSRDIQTRSSKRPRLEIDAEDWEDQDGGDEARRSEQTTLHGHCKNCGVQVCSQDFNVSVGVQTDSHTSDLVPVTRNDNQNFDLNEERVFDYRIPQPSSSPEMGEVEVFPQADDQVSYNPSFNQIQEKYEPYAEDAHVVLNSDGINHQLAILLTKDIASQIRDVGMESRALDQHEELLKELEHEVLSAKSQVCGTDFFLQSVYDDTERTRLQQEANQYEEAVRRAEQRRNTLEQETSILRLNGLHRRDRLQHQLENILAESGLLDLTSLKPPAIEHQARDNHANHGPTSPICSESVESATDPEELLRCAALQEVEEAFEAFQKADNNFDYWQQHYWNEEEENNQMIAAGTLKMSRTDFDLNMYEQKQDFTRTLIDAEERNNNAIAHAKGLGLDVSLYYDHELVPKDQWKDDGYGESQEASLVDNVDRGIIYSWLEGLCAESSVLPSVEPSEPSDVQKCDTISNGVSTSHSVVAGYSAEYGWLFLDRIASWKEYCSMLREKQPGTSHGEPREECIIPSEGQEY